MLLYVFITISVYNALLKMVNTSAINTGGSIMGEFLAGVAVTLFVGFLANRMGYLSVHKKEEKASSGTGGSGGGGGNVDLK